MKPNPEGLAIGIDIGGTKMLGCVVDESCAVIDQGRAATPTELDREEALDVLEEFVRSLHELGKQEVGTIPVGIGLPGMVTLDGVMRFSPHLHALDGVDVRARLSERLGGVAVSVGNDANCAALCEALVGAGKDWSDVLMLTLGTGIGAGWVRDGELILGAHGYAGELGHMKVDPDGLSCPGGGRGCWERYVSGTALERLVQEAVDRETLTIDSDPGEGIGQTVKVLAQRGDLVAKGILDELSLWLARGLGFIVAMGDPGVIILGGGLTDLADEVIPRVVALLPTILEGGTIHESVSLRIADFGERSGAIGASLRARRSS